MAITISTCMIVKNEESILDRCLQSVAQISDELIIIDTGSTDRTKEIAYHYTDKVYDFQWINDFSVARNYSFSKATMDYIYVADADEVIDEQNITKFKQLKEVLLPEIDVVQMYYANQLENGSSYNFDRELRPKLYKRLRSFIWHNAVHEEVQLNPIIYDSDIDIQHKPLANHSNRDFSIFLNVIRHDGTLNTRLIRIYIKELFISGSDADFLDAYDYFNNLSKNDIPEELIHDVQAVLIKVGLINNDLSLIMEHALKNLATEAPTSEVCYMLGEHYEAMKNYNNAIIWYYNAAFESEAEIILHYGGDYPLLGLSRCYKALGLEENELEYLELYNNWSPQA